MDVEPGEGQAAAEASEPTAEKLNAYVEANSGKFTDAAITAELTRAGYPAEEIRAALEETARSAPPSQTGRAVLTILVAYAVTFAILSLGMLANAGSGSPQEFRPDAGGGILILGGSLGVALLLSLLWVGSRRASALLFAALLGVYGVSSLGSGGIVGIVLIAIAIALVVLVLRRSPAPSRRATQTLGVLLSIPVILLVIVAGLCIATGLPIPHNG